MVAVEQGVDALGFVFYPPSPRAVEVAQAASIVAALPPFVTSVALFVNADAQAIAEVVSQVRIDLIQFHGNECPEYCAQHGRPWIKAVRMRADADLAREIVTYRQAQALLLDAYRPGMPGGTGETFDWSRIHATQARRIVLAGGLDADNVARAITQVRPYAVDVSGGVEATRGIKDPNKIAQFMQAVRSGDQ